METGLFRIYLCRHGQTDWNLEKRIQGGTDIPLNATGRRQAEQLASTLSGIQFDAVYSSALQRSWQTAEIIAGIPVTRLTDLNEQLMGVFEGRYYDGRDPLMLTEFLRRRNDPHDSLDGGESAGNHRDRIDRALGHIRDRHPAGGQILIVGHGGTNSLLLQALLNCQFDRPYMVRQDNTELFLIEVRPASAPRLWRLVPSDQISQALTIWQVL